MRNKVSDLSEDQTRSMNISVKADESIQEIIIDNNQNSRASPEPVLPGSEINQLNARVKFKNMSYQHIDLIVGFFCFLTLLG